MIFTETIVNATRGYAFYEETLPLEDTIFEGWTRGEVFQHLQKEHGRCKGYVYIDGGAPVGWVFEKLDNYTDTGDPYLREAWITFGVSLDDLTDCLNIGEN